MSNDAILTPAELEIALNSLPGWELRDKWLCRKFVTPGWSHTLMLVNAIGFIAEAAWHHPDLEVGYAHVTVKLQTHRVLAITYSDIDLARQISESVLWKPVAGGPLPGYPKHWVR